MQRIKFGTSGWRGILADNFTFQNVKTVTQAIADHLRAHNEGELSVMVGHDSRFMADRFARESAQVLAASGIKVFLCRSDTPTPVISFEILRQQLSGAINFTASHNPGEYNGIKFSPDWGGPALPETTQDIEDRANQMMGNICYREMLFDDALKEGLIVEVDVKAAYFAALDKIVDLSVIAASGIKIAVNPLYGAGRGYLDRLLAEAGISHHCINNRSDPNFGGYPPEPAEESMADFIRLVRGDDEIQLGLALDGDADRFGVLDADGSYIEPNYILALLYDYFIRRRNESGDAARSVATSHLLDAVAGYHGYKVLQTPVGFKYIGEYIRDNKIVLGGEESAGMSIRGHVPEKDGILVCLLVAEMVAVEKKTIKELLADLYARVGTFVTKRGNLLLTPQLEKSFAEKVKNFPDEFAGKKRVETILLDGSKFVFEDGSWILFRKSGTEPVVRVYAESHDRDDLKHLLAQASDYILKD